MKNASHDRTLVCDGESYPIWTLLGPAQPQFSQPRIGSGRIVELAPFTLEPRARRFDAGDKTVDGAVSPKQGVVVGESGKRRLRGA